MKKIIKNVFLFTIIILSLVFAYPSNAYALTEQNSYIDINKVENLEVGDLTFTNISFRDYSSSSTMAFGLTGVVTNISNDAISYTSTIYYYDSSYNLVAQGYNLGTAISGVNNFNQMSNLSILNGHSVNEIYYYRLSIEIIDNENSSITDVTYLTPSKNKEYSSYDYVIDKYDINIIVNENNTFDITETITAYFNVSKHGIFRTIPLKNTITRLDGTTSTNRTQVTNVSVDNEYTTSKEKGNYKLQIGSTNRMLKGEQKYVIKYTYNLGKDPLEEYDELYYNIIGSDWDTVIGNITFTITMPKEFDASKLGFSSGNIGSTDNSKVKYNVSGNTITGSYDGILYKRQALTVRCELPEGYFVGAGLNINIMNYIMLLIPIIFLLISIFLWYKYGRDDQVVETVEFYPPEGFNSLEVGFLYKGKANNKDVISLLIYLANKGYIKIAEDENVSLSSEKAGFKVTKLKEYDGNNINEQMFLKGLFIKRPGILSSENIEQETTNSIDVVSSDDLYNNFHITMSDILLNINNKENINKIFEKSASSKKKFVMLMIIVSYCLISIPLFLTYGEDMGLLSYLLASGLIFAGVIILIINTISNIYENDEVVCSKIVKQIFDPLLFELIWGGLWGVLVIPLLKQDLFYSIGYGLGIVCIFCMSICFKYLPKRTPYGNELLGKIKGFKKFLRTVEKEKLEAMVMQDPAYFYNILPYSYVLGVSNKWIKKFESISMQAPSWYDSVDAFDMITFGSFMNSTMTSAENSMSSSPSGSLDDSSGGGSSDGGSGGGGGGSW